MSRHCIVSNSFFKDFIESKVVNRIYNVSALIHFVNQTMLVLSRNFSTLLLMTHLFTKASIGLRNTSPNGKDTFHQADTFWSDLLTNVPL